MLNNIFSNVKIHGTQQGKIHNVWHPNEDYRHAKRQENMAHSEDNNESVETDPELTQKW